VVRFILPVRGLGRGKSRLGLSATLRRDLVSAMLADAIAAARATHLGPVVVVSPDPDALDLAEASGAEPFAHSGGLNAAIAAAAGPGRCAALLPDLPAVRSGELAQVLRTWTAGFVPDASGLGTTMLFGQHLRPSFGPGSAAAHAASGYHRIDLPLCGLTLDVDTWQDLQRAIDLGVGLQTSKLLARQGADPALRIGP
jgi:2-phospho-L-lactate guanylyltransferase